MMAMKHLFIVFVVILMSTTSAQAQFEWAYQRVDEVLPQADLDFDESAPRTVPGSSLQRTQEQIDDRWNPPDLLAG